jgi:hypothetical protein
VSAGRTSHAPEARRLSYEQLAFLAGAGGEDSLPGVGDLRGLTATEVSVAARSLAARGLLVPTGEDPLAWSPEVTELFGPLTTSGPRTCAWMANPQMGSITGVRDDDGRTTLVSYVRAEGAWYLASADAQTSATTMGSAAERALAQAPRGEASAEDADVTVVDASDLWEVGATRTLESGAEEGTVLCWTRTLSGDAVLLEPGASEDDPPTAEPVSLADLTGRVSGVIAAFLQG